MKNKNTYRKNKSINLSTIKKIEVFINKPYDTWYEYKHEKKLLGRTIRKEGVYKFSLRAFKNYVHVSEDRYPPNMIVKDKKLYYKPFVALYYLDDNCDSKFFETEEEAYEYKESFMKGSKKKWL